MMHKTVKLHGLEHCLVLFPNWVGDAVMAQSLVITLKQAYPNMQIDALATPWIADVVRAMPQITQCHTFGLEHGKLQLKQRWKIAQSLKPQSYDLAIVLPNNLKSALIPWLAKIPIRIGHLGESRYGLLTHPLLKDHYPDPNTMIEFYRSLLSIFELATPLTLENRPRLNNRTSQTSKQLNVEHREDIKPIILAPGAEYGPSKQWSTKQASLFLTKCAKEFPNTPLLLIGSAKDTQIATEIEQQFNAANDFELSSPVRNLCGKTSLKEALTLIAGAKAVIANDSGLLHIAGALNVPCVGLYGSTCPSWAPPVGDFSDVVYLNLPCSPCKSRVCPLQHHQCMQNLSADLVWSHFISVVTRKQTALPHTLLN